MAARARYYTKQMGEEIGLNQYFIATHNPYLLCAILEKTNKTDVAVFVTHFRDFETRVKQLTEDQLDEMLGGDPFFMSHRNRSRSRLWATVSRPRTLSCLGKYGRPQAEALQESVGRELARRRAAKRP